MTKLIKQKLKEKYNLSNYQIAQIAFLAKSFLSEMSKISIMGFLFHNRLPYFFFTLFIMLFLRCSTGGLHFYTYTGCLITSTIYVWLSIYPLPTIIVPLYTQILLLILCIVCCYYIGPITSKYRPKECRSHFSRDKKFISIFIFLYTLILYIMPDNQLLIIGFWVIILHSLQLFIAKILQKGEIITNDIKVN